jgi:biopolymer transport protein ExbD
MLTESELTQHLRRAVVGSRAPLTLIIQADKSIPYGQLVEVALLAQNAGIYDTLLATQPRVVSAAGQP